MPEDNGVRKLKILYHHRIASKDGQYVHVEEMIKAFKLLGHDVLIVGPRVSEGGEFGGDGGIVDKLKKYLPKMIYELVEFAYSIPVFFKLRKAVHEFAPDVLYERYNLFLPAGVWIKKLYRIPMFSEINAPLFQERGKFDGLFFSRLALWSEQYVWRNADVALPVTAVLATVVADAGVNPSNIFVVHNGIDPQQFREAPSISKAKSNFGLDGKIVLGFTGFMRGWHGLDSIVKIVASDRSEELFALLVGDGPAREDIESLARQLNVSDRVKVTGVVRRSEIPAYVAAFDIALQPDVVDYASPLKLIEYLALGKAIVAPDKSNIRELLVHESNALLFKPGETDAFETAINRMCLSSQLRERLGAGASETIAKLGLTWRENASRVERLAEGLIAERISSNRSEGRSASGGGSDAT